MALIIGDSETKQGLTFKTNLEARWLLNVLDLFSSISFPVPKNFLESFATENEKLTRDLRKLEIQM